LTKFFGFEEKGKKNNSPIPRGRERSCEGKKKNLSLPPPSPLQMIKNLERKKTKEQSSPKEEAYGRK